MSWEQKTSYIRRLNSKVAEGQGFEPWKGYKPLPVFKTGAFNRSAIPPAHGARYYQFQLVRQEASQSEG